MACHPSDIRFVIFVTSWFNYGFQLTVPRAALETNLTHMTDQEHLKQLILSRHPCIAIATHDEHYVLSVLRQVAAERGVEMWLWSVTLGWRDGLVADGPPVAETEHPAAAMYYVANLPPKARMYVTLDLAEHLQGHLPRLGGLDE